MEKEAPDALIAQPGKRAALLQEIRDSWRWQTRLVTAEDIERWNVEAWNARISVQT